MELKYGGFTASVTQNQLLCNFIEIAVWRGCCPVNLVHIFRTPFPKNTSVGMLLKPNIFERDWSNFDQKMCYTWLLFYWLE